MSGRSTQRLRELNDRALWPLIDAADDAAREAAIESVLSTCVEPVTATVLARFRRTASLRAEDLEELSSAVVLRMIRKLRAAALFEEHAVAALESYVATLTYNALYDLRRQRAPERHRLKKSLRYVLTRDSRFALWESADGPVAGLQSWTRRADVLTSAHVTPTRAMANRGDPGGALAAIFRQLGAPVGLEALVDLVADLWNVRDVAPEKAETADGRRDQHESLEQRQYLERLWGEIRELPANQRAALLLNLRDSAGANAVVLFLLLEIASPAEIAAAAGMTERELEQVWETLPLDDLTIAARLHLTRQQVINLRQAARARLARRMSQK